MNRLRVMIFPGSRWYAAIQTETGFLFHYCTKKGDVFDEREFQRSVRVPGPKDIVVNNDQILERELKILSPCDPRDISSGCIRLRTAEETYRFTIVGKHGKEELRRFFGVSDSEISLPEPLPNYGDSLERNEKDEAKYIALFILCAALDLAVLLCAVFLPYRPWLILGIIALVLPVVLVLVHPEWYTLIHDTGNAKYFNGKRMIPAMFLLFAPAFLLALRLPQITYLSNIRAYIICAMPMLVLSVIVWLLSRERSRAPVLLALVLACWMFLGAGVGHAINAMDYYYSPPTLTEQCRIAALERREGVRGGASYLVTIAGDKELVFNVDREYYETLSVGGIVTVDYFNGALGAAFADIREPWE